ncbi:ribonuclease H-like domain-containing protein [Halomicrobium urmianum]|uniref:ribonuclease H-like domain-containing protein n=1 Tax=Halomicrobium urmianum TaxID=1586233 RepID=UPI001CDA49A5|nr:ribonuclease H-like domain-containing protein [Halomicrobium urmianum]
MRVENSFIPVRGVGEKTERSLWEAGVTHWDDFRPDPVGETTAERIQSFIDEGYDRLADGDVTYFDQAFPNSEQWRLYDTFSEDACFFDIETTGLDHHRDSVTTVSFHQGGETETLVQGDDLSAESLRATLGEADLLVTFNGKRFDVPFLEESFGVDLDCPHLDLMYTCKKLDLSGGLKEIEQSIGIERDRPDISGRDAVRLWREHERGVDGSLETLIEYNREDAVNLRTLADEVTAALDERVFVG